MYQRPPFEKNFNNDLRKVGFEIEYSGLEIEESVEIINNLFGGKVKPYNKYYFTIEKTSAGDFTVKIDSSFLYEKKYAEILDKVGIRKAIKEQDHNIFNKIEKVLEEVASGFIPNEIVTPPVSINKLDTFDPLIKEMKKKNAEGTGESLIYAFATHINPEVPSLDVDLILRYLRSFLLLYEWLFKELKIDFTRKLTSFIDPFAMEYMDLVLDPAYNPDLDKFANDYIRFNPKRDRPLDLYPVLGFLKPDTREKEKSGIVKTRPTFHYRLPNSEIDIRNWSLSYEWNYWWYVEKLAYEENEIEDLSNKYLELRKNSILNFKGKWIEITDQWVKKYQ